MRFYNDYYANDFSVFSRDHSDVNKNKGETWISLKLKEFYNKAKAILFENKDKLIKLSNELMKNKVLLQEDINKIIKD